MFEIRERFTNLRKIDVQYSNIGSLVGIEDRIKQIHSSSSSSSSSSSRSVFSDNNLRELNLNGNPVLYHVLIGGGDDDDSDGDNDDDSATTAKYHKEKSALLTFLDTFNGISNLGLYLRGNYRYIGYDPDVEHVLRINNAGRRFISDGEISSDTITTTTTAAPVINHALWPIIFERAYKKSDEIYEVFYDPQEERDKMKCATGLFHLVRHYLPSFLDPRDCAECDGIINNNNNDHRKLTTSTLMNCKRKRSEM